MSYEMAPALSEHPVDPDMAHISALHSTADGASVALGGLNVHSFRGSVRVAPSPANSLQLDPQPGPDRHPPSDVAAYTGAGWYDGQYMQEAARQQQAGGSAHMPLPRSPVPAGGATFNYSTSERKGGSPPSAPARSSCSRLRCSATRSASNADVERLASAHERPAPAVMEPQQQSAAPDQEWVQPAQSSTQASSPPLVAVVAPSQGWSHRTGVASHTRTAVLQEQLLTAVPAPENKVPRHAGAPSMAAPSHALLLMSEFLTVTSKRWPLPWLQSGLDLLASVEEHRPAGTSITSKDRKTVPFDVFGGLCLVASVWPYRAGAGLYGYDLELIVLRKPRAAPCSS